MTLPLLPFVKNLRIEYENRQAFVYFDFISFPSGAKLEQIEVIIPDETSSGFICTDEQAVFWSEVPQDTCLLWYNDSLIVEEYFYRSEFGLLKSEVSLRLPQVMLQEQYSPVLEGELFRSFGKNYPPMAPIPSFGELIPEFPGVSNSGPGGVIVQKIEPLTKTLVSSFEQDLEAKKRAAVLSYYEFMDPDAGNAYYWGLAQDPYSVIPQELIPDVCAKTIPQWPQASVLWFVNNSLGTPIYSPKDQASWQYAVGLVLHPCDLNIATISEDGLKTLIYNAETHVEGDLINWGPLNIQLTRERYSPLVKVENPILPEYFIPGLQYQILPSQTLPPNWVSTSATSGYIPSATPIRDSLYTNWSGIWEDKTGVLPAQYLVTLLKLKKGKTYDYVEDSIATGPEDWLESLGPETYPYEDLLADITPLGGDEVAFKLPFNYARGGVQWAQAEMIAKEFVSPEKIRFGYHEFVAEYSAADEPVWSETSQEIGPYSFTFLNHGLT